jgi:putative nucleotidyltransferase with HDIG domain
MEDIKKIKVLVVDDNSESLYLLDRLLVGSGYLTSTAENGVEALKKLKKEKIDIIISDVLMPKMDGFKLCRACKKDERLRKIPFLFYTATYRRKEDEDFGLSLGAERFIMKPIEPVELLKIISDVLEEQKKRKPEKVLARPIKEKSYLAEYNKRIIKKLEDKVISLDKEITRRKKTEDELHKRLKELDCLYSIANLAIEDDITLEKLFKDTIKYISTGMQRPEMVYSRIIFDDREFKTKDFKKTKHKESKDIDIEGEKRGAIEIYCSGRRPGSFSGAFSREEKQLINGISKMINVLVERKLYVEKLEESYQKIDRIFGCITKTLAHIVEERDPYTSGHQNRVKMLAIAIAEGMGLDKDKIEAINIASLVHDIGKIRVPASILTKPGKLSDIEFEIVKTHVDAGYNILKDIEFPYPIARIVQQHHEKLDGSGYPRGLKSEDIEIEAKIIAVADSMEAMISDRPYRPALKISRAIWEMKRDRGKLYDPKAVDICVKLIRKKDFRNLLGKNK